MSKTETPAEQVTCERCHRPLKSAASIAAKKGPRCAAIDEATKGLNAKQAEKALELVADGGVVKVRKGVYAMPSSDGQSRYLASVKGICNCPWGVKRTSTERKPCAHVGAAILKDRPRRALPVPAPRVAEAVPDIWTQLEALGALASDDFIPAF